MQSKRKRNKMLSKTIHTLHHILKSLRVHQGPLSLKKKFVPESIELVKMVGNMDGPDMKEVTRDNARGITPTDFEAIMYSSIEACPFACCLKRE